MDSQLGGSLLFSSISCYLLIRLLRMPGKYLFHISHIDHTHTNYVIVIFLGPQAVRLKRSACNRFASLIDCVSCCGRLIVRNVKHLTLFFKVWGFSGTKHLESDQLLLMFLVFWMLQVQWDWGQYHWQKDWQHGAGWAIDGQCRRCNRNKWTGIICCITVVA